MLYVALHPEGVDRNFNRFAKVKETFVALHPEGVDRNREISVAAVAACIRSPSTRRAWIEIRMSSSVNVNAASPSTRRAWIEIENRV